MDEMNKDPKQLSPEEQLDLLLEKFLEDPNDELHTFVDAPSSNDPEITSSTADDSAEIPDAPAEDIPVTNDPVETITDGTPTEPPDMISFWDIVPESKTPTEAENADTADFTEEIETTEASAEIVTDPNGTLEEDTPVETMDTKEQPAEGSPTEMLLEDHQDSEKTDEDESVGLFIPEDMKPDQIPEQATQEHLPPEPAAETVTIKQEESIAHTEETTPAMIPEEEKNMPDEPLTQQPDEEKIEDEEQIEKKEEKEKEEEEEEEEEEDEEDIHEEPAPPKKRRPKNTKTYGFFGIPHMLATIIWLGIIVFIGVGLGKFVWNCAADVLALGRPDTQVVITITEDDDLDSIAEKLHATGLIRYPSLFKIYGDISDAMDSIRTGTFKLNTLFDYHALVDAMSSNQRRETTNVTVPEGYTCAQMFQLLENRGITTVEKLEDAAANGDLGDYWFLEGVERGTANCLEGFLFPDTYTFYLDHDPVGVLKKFLDNFNKRFNEKMKIKLDTLNMGLSEMMRENGLSEEYIAAHQVTVRDVVIIASMIEKETASNPESYNISSVIYNRLTNPDEYPMLQIDAALVYYTGRSEITAEDLITDHPYNTYTRPGLIPGAISNPGSYSLDAALTPTDTEYYYYALNPSTGTHHFSKTRKEHEDFLESIRTEEPEEEEPQE